MHSFRRLKDRAALPALPVQNNNGQDAGSTVKVDKICSPSRVAGVS